MALQSMTGFARASADVGASVAAWELRSVNGKGLDVRLRLPPGYERLEASARQLLQKAFSRGNINATLTMAHTGGAIQPVVNEEFLRDIAALGKRLETQFGCAPATADGLLALKGVLDFPEIAEDPDSQQANDNALLALLGRAISSLADARASEGAALREILLSQVDMIEALTLKAEVDPSREPARIRERIAQQVKLLLDAVPLDEQRLYTEAAFLATKADIREEIDRLKAHIVSARALLGSDTAVGRKLDFLAQEFNRESNTLCSKSNATAVTVIGLELKAVVDQFREQIQNVE